MRVPIVDAVQFLGRARSGRNKPPILGCAAGDDLIEFYVKLRNGKETSKLSLIFELLGVQIATALGISTAEPAIVQISAEFCDAVEELELQALFRNNIGPNFGSKALSGYGVFPVTDVLHPSDYRRASEIFVFDALVQNVDRESRNPNLLVRGNDWRVIDHEVAFSFTRAFTGLDTGGDESLVNLLRKHMFYRPLKGREIDLDLFARRLGDMLDTGILYEWISDLPPAWTAGEEEILNRISRHFEGISKDRYGFLNLVKRILQ
jgi:hypothetical protein